MTNNELLLAISSVLDTKLKSQLQPIRNDLQAVKEEVQEVKADLRVVKSDLQAVKEEVQEVKSDLQAVKEEVQEVKSDQQSLRKELHHMRLCQENIILPRLNTIEACYTDTYNRYKNYADRMEETFDDVDLLKRVVSEHSEKLQKLA